MIGCYRPRSTLWTLLQTRRIRDARIADPFTHWCGFADIFNISGSCETQVARADNPRSRQKYHLRLMRGMQILQISISAHLITIYQSIITAAFFFFYFVDILGACQLQNVYVFVYKMWFAMNALFRRRIYRHFGLLRDRLVASGHYSDSIRTLKTVAVGGHHHRPLFSATYRHLSGEVHSHGGGFETAADGRWSNRCNCCGLNSKG